MVVVLIGLFVCFCFGFFDVSTELWFFPVCGVIVVYGAIILSPCVRDCRMVFFFCLRVPSY